MLKKKQRAFTLIELMVTVVVLGVVLAVGIPSFNAQIARNTASGMAEDLLEAMNFARSEAVKRGGLVTVCATDDGVNCSNSPNDWPKGFMVVVDRATANAPSPTFTPPQDILRRWEKQAPKANIQVLFALPGTTNVSFVRYTNLGTLASVFPAGGLRMRVKMKDSGQGLDCVANSAQQYALSAAGTIRLDNSACWN